MNKRWKTIILLFALVQIAFIIGLLALPSLAQGLPGEMRMRIARVPLGSRTGAGRD